MVHAAWSPNSICQLSVLAQDSGQAIVNVFHFEAPGTTEATLTTDALAQAWGDIIASDWVTNVQASWNACHAVPYAVQAYRSQILERPGLVNHRLVPIDHTTGVNATGVLAAGHDSMSDAAVVKWKTPISGRSHRGRSYIGPLAATFTSVTTPGLLTAAAVTAINAWATVMKNRYTGVGAIFTQGNLTIYSRPYNNGEYSYPTGHGLSRTIFFPPDYNGQSTHVTDYSLDTIVRDQRRRDIGVGA